MARTVDECLDGELAALIHLDAGLRTRSGAWLLVEVKPHGVPLYNLVLRVDGVLVIGRDPAAGLVLDGALVSRRHALVRATERYLEIEDISRHGTLVDGLPLHSARARLETASQLMVGCNRVRVRRLA